MNEQINKFWCTHTKERNEILIHPKTWMNLKGMLIEKIQTQKVTDCMIPFI